MRYGYDSEYRQRRHGTYGATSSTVSAPLPTNSPYDQVEQPCGGSKFDDEVEEKEADEIVEGRRTSEGSEEEEV